MSAEQGAHRHNLTSLSEDETHDAIPDIFCIVAHESLLDTLQPAFKHLVKVLASRYPSRLGWLYRNADELYLALNGIIEYFSLQKLNASFAERFYGMKRATVDGLPWTAQRKFLNLVLLVGIPYIRRKLQIFYDYKSVEIADGKLQGNDMKSKMQRAIVSIYPYLHMTWSAIVFSYFVRFLLHYSDIHSPVLRLSGAKLTLLTLSDMEEESSVPWSHVTLQKTLIDKLKFLISKATSSVPDMALQTFSSGVFFLQFLQWYSTYSQTEGEREVVASAAAISAPKLPEHNRSSMLNCPLCMKTRTNSTVLSTSGYVFCYPCIYRYVQKHGKCPVTSFPATLEHLVKIYMPGT